MSIYSKLKPWQSKVINKFKDRKSYGLFLDMGLGKTVVSLAFAEVNQCSKVIVITMATKAEEPISLPGSWLWWAKQSSMRYSFLQKKFKETQILADEPQLLLTNYEQLYQSGTSKNRRTGLVLKDNIEAFIKSCKGQNVAIIIDESHYMKTISSMRTKAINKLKDKLEKVAGKVYAYLLTGSPFTSGYIDLYSQLKFLGLDMNKAEFIDKFCYVGMIDQDSGVIRPVPGLLGWQQPICAYKNLDRLFELVHEYALTIESSEVEQLPEQVFIEHALPMSHAFKLYVSEELYPEEITPEIKRRNVSDILFDRVLSASHKKVNNPFYSNIAYPDTKWFAETNGVFWMRARQLSIGFQGNEDDAVWYDRRRLDALKEFMKENKENYVLFYNYTPELFELYNICEELGYNIDVYCGHIKSLTFYDRYERASEEERLRMKKSVIIANFASGSTGKNWQLYNQCIVFSVPVYKDWAQGIKRLHRIGQTKTVFYHCFYQKNWLDYSMRKSLNERTDYNFNLFKQELDLFNTLPEVIGVNLESLK